MSARVSLRDQAQDLVRKAVHVSAVGDSSLGVNSLSLKGVDDLRIRLLSVEDDVAFETSNLLIDSQNCNITLKSSSLGCEQPYKSIKHDKHNIKLPYFIDMREIGDTCQVHIALNESLESDKPFGALILRFQSWPSLSDLADAVELAGTIAASHHEELKKFTTVLTSSLFTSPRSSAPVEELPEEMFEEVADGYCCTELAPLPASASFSGPLPAISLLSLRFLQKSLEGEFVTWKAQNLYRVDLIALIGCIFFNSMGTTSELLFNIWGIVMSFTVMTMLLGRRYFLQYRDILLALVSAGTMARIAMVAAQTGGSDALYHAARSMPVAALLLQIKFIWQVPLLITSAAWTISQLPAACTIQNVDTSVTVCMFHASVRTIICGLMAPLTILYVLEVITRRVFLSHKILVAEAIDDDE